MHRLLLGGLLVVFGCQGVVGPLERRCRPPKKIDDPCLPIDEQERRGRELLPMPENSPAVGPRTFAEPPVR